MNMRSDIQIVRNPERLARTVETARLLADPTRLRILSLLLTHRDGMCVYEIAEAIGSSPSATSHQLAKLEAHDIVCGFRDGQKMCYEFAHTRAAQRTRALLNLMCTL